MPNPLALKVAARYAAKWPPDLSAVEKQTVMDLGHKLSGISFNTVDIDKFKPTAIKSLHKKGVIYAKWQIRFTERGYDLAEKL